MALWNSVTHVVRALQARNDQRAGRVSGTFNCVSDDDLAALQDCLTGYDDTRAVVDGADDAGLLAKGKSYTVTIAPRLGFGVIVRSLDHLLKSPQARVREPDGFYLLHGDESSVDVAAPDSAIGRYRLVLDLVKLFKEAAAFLDVDRQQLVFIDSGKFEVPVEYTVDELAALDLTASQALLVSLPKDIHREQCGAILASAIVALTKATPAKLRFSYVLRNASQLKTQYDEGYKLFASGFSYDKVRDEVEAARVDYAGKIHKAFGDIQNQLLGIPVATVIVATQMKIATTWGYEFWLNTSVLLGVWIFAILIWLLLRNQGHTLQVLQDEITRQQKLIGDKYHDVADSFKDVFVFLNWRLKRQRLVLRIIDFVVAGGLLLAHVVYLVLTPVALTWLCKAIFH